MRWMRNVTTGVAVAIAAITASGMTAQAAMNPRTGPTAEVRVVTSTAASDGPGVPITLDCGTAQLTVNANTHRYLIALSSIKGIITGGFYSINTDGVGNIIQTGFISAQNSTTSRTLGQIAVPGLNVHAAVASGIVITSQTTCTFIIAAPWN
jgi:hypothetical protein